MVRASAVLARCVTLTSSARNTIPLGPLDRLALTLGRAHGMDTLQLGGQVVGSVLDLDGPGFGRVRPLRHRHQVGAQQIRFGHQPGDQVGLIRDMRWRRVEFDALPLEGF